MYFSFYRQTFITYTWFLPHIRQSRKRNVTALTPKHSTDCVSQVTCSEIFNSIGRPWYWMHGYVNSFKKGIYFQKYVKYTNTSSINNKNYQQKCLGSNIPEFSNAFSILDIYVVWPVSLVTVLNEQTIILWEELH